jgi:hypothetical protein
MVGLSARYRRAMLGAMVDVYLESGSKGVFACAVDWPGWCRSGKDEDSALQALATAAPRYAVVAAVAKVVFPARAAARLDVVERVPGSASTDFGVPGTVISLDSRPLTKAQALRLVSLVEASWRIFDGVAASAPAELRKGPRGGGRDRDAIVDHVLGAEVAYGRKIGIRLSQPALHDALAIAAHRSAILDALRSSKRAVGKGWPTRYAARRIAWHALDHAWEIEDRSPSS